MNNILNNISFVLVSPKTSGNIGSVARAMKNMGLRDLRVVNPVCSINEEAFKMAVNADDILHSIKIFPDLKKALEEFNLIIGATRRKGKNRQNVLTPDKAAEKTVKRAGKNKAAFVFGREDAGLLNEELDLCRYIVEIPSDSGYPSLNLSHAAVIIAYELFIKSSIKMLTERKKLASSKELELMFEKMEETLLKIDFLPENNPSHIMRTVRSIFGRAELSMRDMKIIMGMFSQINWYRGENQG